MKENSEIKKGDSITILPDSAPIDFWNKTGVVVKNPRTFRGITKFFIKCEGVYFWYNEREIT